jgi:hypothetical protein
VPVDLTIEYTDGSKAKIHRSVAVWEKASQLTLAVHSALPVKKVILGSTYTPDSHPADNEFDVR